ncbi:dTDP-4-dehydrorhamnose 3,5-epimerase [Mesorhizobium sp. CN2-181]|uniref:dTDP-4-dehydrorhamnose 3,5-epimerase n=1 Tax=Mesorhizobium yinganensis TaxID=3157707 RepID=UPI0032B7E5D3
MKVRRLAIPEIVELEPQVFGDGRGFFLESFNQRRFDEAIGEPVRFVQDNHSRSQFGVLRGLHFQRPPYVQGKLVRVVAGEVLDVAVDIRRSSPTFGAWVSAVLSAENRRQLWVPPGFAHGFVTLSQTAEFLYKVTDYYNPESERSILWNDPEINIDWKVDPAAVKLSARDAAGLALRSAEIFD